jgi:hypothetical protein
MQSNCVLTVRVLKSNRYLKRVAQSSLPEGRSRPGWKPLELRVARQTGKTHLMAQVNGLQLAEKGMKRRAKVYYFDRGGGATRNISNLDSSPGQPIRQFHSHLIPTLTKKTVF